MYKKKTLHIVMDDKIVSVIKFYSLGNVFFSHYILKHGYKV